jgi:hypothetical protein
MSLTLRQAAFHEAGHALRVFRENSNALLSLHLYQQAETWQGETNVVPGSIPNDRVIYVALAGLMAEARFNGFEAFNGPVILAHNQRDLVDRLLDYFALPNTPENQHTLETTPVWVTDSVGDHHVATAISFADLQTIPNNRRNAESVGHAIHKLRHFFNRRRRWWQVQGAAETLQHWEWPATFDSIDFYSAAGIRTGIL